MNTVETFKFPFKSPPLAANQRLHWAAKARRTRDVRTRTMYAVQAFPPCTFIEVTLTWYVKTRTRRDVDNIVPTLKAMCDGIVDAQIVPDDTPEFMKKNMPEVIYSPNIPEPYMALTLTEVI